MVCLGQLWLNYSVQSMHPAKSLWAVITALQFILMFFIIRKFRIRTNLELAVHLCPAHGASYTAASARVKTRTLAGALLAIIIASGSFFVAAAPGPLPGGIWLFLVPAIITLTLSLNYGLNHPLVAQVSRITATHITLTGSGQAFRASLPDWHGE